MKLTFEKIDGRKQHGFAADIIDEHGKKHGYVQVYHPMGRHLYLFDGKYEVQLADEAECRGFLRGVTAALNRLSPADVD